jgi:hypothetical protein
MKNIFSTFFFTFLTIGVFAQEGFKIGLQGGLPVGEYNDRVGLVAGLDTGYMYALGEAVDMGIATGFLNGFPEKFPGETVLADLPHIQFVPLAGSIRIWPSNSFSFGGDGGYSFGLNEGNAGGFYYRPVIAYLMGPKTEVNLSYTAIRLDDGLWSTVNFGVMYTFTSRRA